MDDSFRAVCGPSVSSPQLTEAGVGRLALAYHGSHPTSSGSAADLGDILDHPLRRLF